MSLRNLQDDEKWKLLYNLLSLYSTGVYPKKNFQGGPFFYIFMVL